MSTSEYPWINSYGRKTSYRLPDDVCANCGMKGGVHYSNDGISWCHPYSTRRAHAFDSRYQTSFELDESYQMRLGGKITIYKCVGDVCENCGRTGGEHCTTDGVSWCYNSIKRAESKDPKHYTSFSYGKRGKLDKNNPNNTFKRKL